MTAHVAGDRRGFALILAIWALAAVALITTVFATSVRREAALAGNALDGATARHLADGAVHLAAAGLSDPQVARTLRIDGAPIALDVAGHPVTVRLYDEGGKVDLNEAPAALLEGLFIVLGAAPADAARIAGAIIAWRDAQDRGMPGPSPTGATRFTSIGQLARIGGMTGTLFAAAAPLVTIDNRQPSVDPWVASVTVLAAVPGLDARSAESLVRDRPPLFYGADGGRLAIAANPLLAPSPTIAISVEATAIVGGYRFTRHAVIAPGRDGGQPSILAWR